MSKLNDLIAEKCPNGVSFEELGNKKLFDFHYGKGNTIPDDFGEYPVYGCNGIVGHTIEYNCENVAIIGHIGSAGLVNWCDGRGFATYNGTICDVKDRKIINSKYLYYFLVSSDLPQFVKGSQPFLSVSDFANVKIPIPPLEVQEEIVRILDNFQDLEAELEAELEGRKKQYAFYRDKLLSFEDLKATRESLKAILALPEGYKVDKVKIEDIYEFRRGSFPQPYTNEKWYGGIGAMPFVQVADMKDEGFLLEDKTKQTISIEGQPKSVFVKKGTVLVSIQGTIGRVAITQYDSYVDRTIAIFTNPKIKDINKRYFAYVLKAVFDYQKQFAHGTTLKTLTKEDFSKFEISLPSLEIQNAIVTILDYFDKYCTDLCDGLPAEIEARKKQYNYYRDLLLTFDDIASVKRALGPLYGQLCGDGVLRFEKIEDICKIISPQLKIKANDYLESGKYPIIDQGQDFIGGYTNEEGGFEKSEYVIFGDHTCVVKYVDFAFVQGADGVKVLKSLDGVLIKYLYYCMSNIQMEVDYSRHWSKMKIETIPIPSINIQQRTVEILDKFEKLTNDLTDGLPAEIALVRKQYEYWRDKLLNFSELKSE